MNEVRIGIVGIGNMGSVHAKNIVDGKIQGLKLTAVCDIDAHKRTWAKENLGEEIALFTDYKEMIKSGYIDATGLKISRLSRNTELSIYFMLPYIMH